MKKIQALGLSFLFFAFIQSNKADEIIEKSIQRRGGRQKISQVKDTVLRAKVINSNGVAEEITYHKRPNKFLSIQYMNGKETQRICATEKGFQMFLTSQKGKKMYFQPDNQAIKLLTLDMSPFKEIDMEKDKTKKKYLGVITDPKTGASVNAIEFKYYDAEWVSYYDTKLNMLITQKQAGSWSFGPINTPDGLTTTEIIEFNIFNGIYFPTKTADFREGKVVSKKDYYSIVINKGLSDELFDIKK
jgi:hypothetical protein